MVKKGYKQTEIGVIPEDWAIKYLSDFGKVQGGGTPSTTMADYWGGDIAWCTPSDITSAPTKYINATERAITDLGLKNSAATVMPAGSILLCTRATIGELKINSIPMATNQGFKNIAINKGGNVDFLYYLLQTKKDRMLELAIGSTFLEISKTALCKIPLQTPMHSDEQSKIADALSDIDSLVEVLENQISKKKAIKQGAMQELLTGKRRLPGFAGEWKICRLDEIADFPTATISTDQFDNRFYVGTDNMIAYKGDVKYNELPLIYPKVRQYQTEDIILSNIRPYLQKIWYATRNGGCSNDVMVIRKKDGHAVEPKFLYYQLSRDGFYDEIMANAVGTKMPRGDKAIVKSYRINMPSDTAEQKAIASILSDADAEIKAMEEKLEKYRQVKQGMMQQLLTGKIRLV